MSARKGVEAELARAQEVIAALETRLEALTGTTDGSRFALYKLVSNLENRLRVSERRREQTAGVRDAVFMGHPDPLVVVDEGNVIVDVNRAAAVAFRHPAEALVGTPLAGVLLPESGSAVLGLLALGFRGEGSADVVIEGGRRYRCTLVDAGVGKTALHLREGGEASSPEDARFASLGRLAASVAHQINNPLAIIQGRVELLGSLAPTDPDALRRQLAVIMDHCRRIGGLMQGLQVFARPRSPRPQVVALEHLVAQVRQQVAQRNERVQLDARVDGMAALSLDEGQVVTAVSALVAYLADLAPRGRAVSLRALGRPGGLEVSVSTEAAIPPGVASDLTSLVAPTRRKLDPAHHVWLSVAVTLVSGQGATLGVEHGQDSTTLVVQIPVGSGAAAPAPVERAPPPLSVLVVDDERLLCETVGFMLAELGHTSAAVHTADAAMERLAAGKIDVVLCDLKLPSMGGEDLAAVIERRWPALTGRVVLTSGLLLSTPPSRPFLQKPFTRDQLAQLLARLGTKD